MATHKKYSLNKQHAPGVVLPVAKTLDQIEKELQDVVHRKNGAKGRKDAHAARITQLVSDQKDAGRERDQEHAESLRLAKKEKDLRREFALAFKNRRAGIK